MALQILPSPLPAFPVRLAAPNISSWLRGNTGVTGVTTHDSGEPGPHVALISLMHGNEIAGAIVLDGFLRSGTTPYRGKLSFVFANIDAFNRFDPRRPTLSRFIDEDMNRVWDETLLQGPRRSIELDRARELRPFIDTVDVVVDLHSMLWPSDSLILSGMAPQGRDLALGLGVPSMVVADEGHMNGRRLIDYPRFARSDTPFSACLVEAGQHWEPSTVTTLQGSVTGVLRYCEMCADTSATERPSAPARMATVTAAVTAVTSRFAFVQDYRGGDVIPQRNTLIAIDGETEIRTPYDNCLLVMPSLRPGRGHTAVRLGRFDTYADQSRSKDSLAG
jgi:hypothetical protein